MTLHLRVANNPEYKGTKQWNPLQLVQGVK